MGFCSDGRVDSVNVPPYRPNLQSVAVAVPEIIAIAVLGLDCEPPILGKGRPQGIGDGTIRKRVGDFL